VLPIGSIGPDRLYYALDQRPDPATAPWIVRRNPSHHADRPCSRPRLRHARLPHAPLPTARRDRHMDGKPALHPPDSVRPADHRRPRLFVPQRRGNALRRPGRAPHSHRLRARRHARRSGIPRQRRLHARAQSRRHLGQSRFLRRVLH
jgi:hypothetical protein